MLSGQNITKYEWFVVASGILSGFIVFAGQIFAGWGMSLYEISILPLLFTIVLLLPFVIFNKKYHLKMSNIWMWLLYGFVSACTVLGQYGAVVLGVPVTVVVLLLYTQPLWTVIFSSLFMHEKITSKDIFSCILVILGVVILVNPFSQSLGSMNWQGILVALLAGISLSGWLVVGSFLSKNKNEPITSKFVETVLVVTIMATSWLFVRNIINDPAIVHFSFKWSSSIWLYILLFNLFAITLNHILYLEGVRKVKTVAAGIIMLLEPVSAAILSVLFLHQMITANILIGGLIILVANYFTVTQAQADR